MMSPHCLIQWTVCRESAQVYAGADGIYTGTVYRTAVAKCAAFSLLWTLMSYVFVRSLHLISAVDAVALFATQSNFFYLLSWIILQRNFVALRVSLRPFFHSFIHVDVQVPIRHFCQELSKLNVIYGESQKSKLLYCDRYFKDRR